MNRDELQEQLRPLIGPCGPKHATIICGRCDERMEQAMASIDAYVASITKKPELWTAEKVAEYTGHADANGARMWLHRNGIKRAGEQPHPDSGRPQALYPANHVRMVCTVKGMV